MSKLFTLNVRDFIKGLVMAVIGAVLTGLYQAVAAGMTPDIRSMLTVGALAGLSYLIKNLFTTSDGKVFGAI